MDELKQIISYKIKIMKQFQTRNNGTTQQKQQLIELLLKQKRKQNSRDVIQSRLLQNLTTRKIEAPYRIQEFYIHSLQLMQMHTPDFFHNKAHSCNTFKKQKIQQDTVDSIVSLYVSFFNRQDCTRRAEQLRHIYTKKLCERGVIIPTILQWFAQWLKKVYRDFIKNKLSELNEKNNSRSNLMQQKNINRNKKFMEEISSQRASLNLIKCEIQEHKQKQRQKQLNLIINKSKILKPDIVDASLQPRVKSQLLDYKGAKRNKKDQRKNTVQNQSLQNNQNEANNKINIEDLNAKKQKILVSQTHNIYLNKDIFFSAFYQQLNAYYKFVSPAMSEQLDENFPRNFRRVDRKQEINKNIKILLKSLVRNQPNVIKDQITKYRQNYYNKFGINSANYVYQASSNDLLLGKLNNYKNSKEKRRAKSVDLKKQQQVRMSQSIDYLGNVKQAQRKQVQKNKIQIQLPQIKIKNRTVGRSVQKIIIVNHEIVPTNRYSRSKILSQRVSAELYKELRNISGIFKNNHQHHKNIAQRVTKHREQIQKYEKYGISDQINKSVQKSPINWYKDDNKNQISELLDGHFQVQPDGIFRLPKLCK